MKFSHPQYKFLLIIQIIWFIYLLIKFQVHIDVPIVLGSVLGWNGIYLFGFIYYLIKGFTKKTILICSNPWIIIINVIGSLNVVFDIL